MSSWHVAAATASVLLAMPPAAAMQPPTPAAAAPYMACPKPPVVPPVKPPSSPPVDPAHRAVGGPALATKGLALPPGAPRPPKVTATSWLVADLSSGAVLGGCGPHEFRTPASVQKLLLAAAVMPHLDPAQVVEVTRSDLDFEPGSSAVGLVLGGRYSVETLWLGLLLNSGNDAANVLARVGGGATGLRGGIQAMNAEARRLGAYQTHAVTPSGLDGPGQFTSAYDLALIARACFARDDFRRYAATRVAQIPAQRKAAGFQISNDNHLLDRYPGMLGGKTGFTDLARQTYVGVAERNGRRLVVTLLGAETQPLGSLGEATALLDWGFALPHDTAVGHLVAPQEGVSTPNPTTADIAKTGAPGRTDGRPRSASTAAVTGIAVGAVLMVLLVVAARQPIAARSRASRRQPAAGTLHPSGTPAVPDESPPANPSPDP
ncbi:MAG TPA: D-alanyl-D-alanine carboxypeptidase [Micromonosporaceae bacterium]|nr:D-alanyl-D-alanine carboxypeptidase [Micromonosporaceae bacterium]